MLIKLELEENKQHRHGRFIPLRVESILLYVCLQRSRRCDAIAYSAMYIRYGDVITTLLRQAHQTKFSQLLIVSFPNPQLPGSTVEFRRNEILGNVLLLLLPSFFL